MRLWVWSLALLSGLRIQHAVICVGRRCGLDPALLWLWRRLAATAPIRPLAWEPPYAEGVAPKRQKTKKKKKSCLKNKCIILFMCKALKESQIGSSLSPSPCSITTWKERAGNINISSNKLEFDKFYKRYQPIQCESKATDYFSNY